MPAYGGDRANGLGAPALIEYNTNTSPKTPQRLVGPIGVRSATRKVRPWLYQVTIQIPDTAPAGVVVVQATVGGVTSTDGALMFVLK